MGREAHCVDTIDFFLIQPMRVGCQAHNMAIRAVWILKKKKKKNQALHVGYEQDQKWFKEKSGRLQRIFPSDIWKSIRDTKICQRNFPERLHK